MKKSLYVSSCLIFILIASACSSGDEKPVDKANKKIKALITFVELGSVNCIPCKAMQPVMKAIEEKYDDQIQVIFYDVWKPEQKQYAQKYQIKLIPTQVFLNADGKELLRHEGFFPEEEIDKFLQQQGLKPLKQGSKT